MPIILVQVEHDKRAGRSARKRITTEFCYNGALFAVCRDLSRAPPVISPRSINGHVFSFRGTQQADAVCLADKPSGVFCVGDRRWCGGRRYDYIVSHGHTLGPVAYRISARRDRDGGQSLVRYRAYPVSCGGRIDRGHLAVAVVKSTQGYERRLHGSGGPVGLAVIPAPGRAAGALDTVYCGQWRLYPPPRGLGGSTRQGCL